MIIEENINNKDINEIIDFNNLFNDNITYKENKNENDNEYIMNIEEFMKIIIMKI